jgi:hypothetical protein
MLILDLDFIDYPTGWSICREYKLKHWEQCSYEVTSGALLCDCDAMPLKWAELKQAHDGSDGLSLAERYLNR